MKELLNHVPGFRTSNNWKKVVAIIYYLFCFIAIFTNGFGGLLILITIPVVFFSIIGVIKDKRKKGFLIAFICGILLFSIGIKLDSDKQAKEVISNNIIVAQNKVIADKKVETIAKAKVISDAKDKKIADAKAIEDKKLADAQVIKDKETARLQVIEDKKVADAETARLQVIEEKKIADEQQAKAESEAQLKAQQEAVQTASVSNDKVYTSNQTNSGVMVWLSETGSKYHSINNCGRMNPDNATQVTLEEAEKSYSPCSKCNPPQ